MDVEELKNIRDYLKISREEMARSLSMTINALDDWEYKKKRVPKGKVELVKYVFNTYFERSEIHSHIASEDGNFYRCPENQLEEKERSIRFLERTINDKEELLQFCRDEINRLKGIIQNLSDISRKKDD